jgi:hypothetical protein
MAEYSRLAKGTVASLGGNTPVKLPFVPDYVELINYTAATTPANGGIPFVKWDANMGQGYAWYEKFNATPVLTTATTSTNGISTFQAGLSLQYGARQQIIGMTKADPIVVNVTAHGYAVGDVVILEGLYQSATTGMPQISNIPFSITAVGDADHFTIKWNGNQSNYTALSGSPTGAYVKKVLYPFLYEPGVSIIEAITTGSTTTVVTTAPHNLVVGQEVAFRIPTAWGTYQLNSLPNTVIPGSPIYGYVITVTDARTFVVNINSTGYTAYNSNQTVASVSGQQLPQVVPVGDVNTGGVQISSGSALYPAPKFLREDGSYSSTINGPAIQGAFVNNTSNGFIIGSTIAGTAADVIYYRAFLHDYSNP